MLGENTHSLPGWEWAKRARMTCGEGSTRDRLLDAAIELFARQGYAATSVAEIQQASGLSPGSGALYKHLPFKRALLREATQRQVNRMLAMREEHDRTRPADTRKALRRAHLRRHREQRRPASDDVPRARGDPGLRRRLWSAVTLTPTSGRVRR